MSNTLYVVLRGEFAMYTEGNQLHLLAPTLEGCPDPKHVYRAGAFTDLPGGADITKGSFLNLENATGGTQRAEDQQGMYIKVGGGPGQFDNEKVQMHITLPLPIRFWPGLRENTKTVQIVTPTGLLPVPLTPTVVSILEYSWDAANEPELSIQDKDGQVGTPIKGAGDPYNVIHIIATSPTKETVRHAQCAFSEACSLLGVNAAVVWDPKGPGPKTPSWVLPGLTEGEVNGPWHKMVTENRFNPTSADIKLIPALDDTDGNCGQITP